MSNEQIYPVRVVIDGVELIFEAILVTMGYTRRLTVSINGIEIFYEPDKDKRYHAVVSRQWANKINKDNIATIHAVGNKLGEIIADA